MNKPNPWWYMTKMGVLHGFLVGAGFVGLIALIAISIAMLTSLSTGDFRQAERFARDFSSDLVVILFACFFGGMAGMVIGSMAGISGGFFLNYYLRPLRVPFDAERVQRYQRGAFLATGIPVFVSLFGIFYIFFSWLSQGFLPPATWIFSSLLAGIGVWFAFRATQGYFKHLLESIPPDYGYPQKNKGVLQHE